MTVAHSLHSLHPFMESPRLWEAISGGAEVAQFFPLFRSEDTADGEGHLGVGFFKAGAGCRNAVNGTEHRALVRVLGFEQGFKFDFFLLEVGVDIDEFHSAILKDRLDLLNLPIAESDGLDDLRVFPPAARRNKAA